MSIYNVAMKDCEMKEKVIIEFGFGEVSPIRVEKWIKINYPMKYKEYKKLKTKGNVIEIKKENSTVELRNSILDREERFTNRVDVEWYSKDYSITEDYTNLTYKIVFDCDAKSLREMYDLDDNDNIRDSLTTEDLEKVVEVERVISSLLKLGKEYGYIKDELIKYVDNFR